MPKLDDDTIVAMLSSGVHQATGFTESRLSKERERATRFYQGEFPNKSGGSNSQYVSMDVYEAVENMKAQLLDVFTGSVRPAKFPELNAEDVEAARVATEYVSHVLFDQNPGFRIFHDVIDDALLYRAGIVKVWWEDKIENEEYEMAEGTMTELQQFLAKHPDAEIKTLELHEDGVTIERALMKLKNNKSRVRIEALPPEEFGISAISKTIKDAQLVFHRQMKSASDLIKEGYDAKLVQSLQDQDEAWLETEPELLLRFEQTDDIVGMRDDAVGGEKARRLILVYECYAELDIEDSGRAELWKVIYAGNVLLHKERVNRKPFIAFVPLPRPHAFWGTNYSKTVSPTQIARTYLTRSIIDHSLITNNPRYQVVRGSVTNPRELMENRIGGIVNVTRPDGILPMPQMSLNPFVFQTIQMLDQNKQELTGISSLSTGLNADAISKQNSGDMVSQLVSLSQVRQRIVARHFAEDFLTDLYLTTYQLVCENEDRQRIVKIAGDWQPIDPTSWPERPQMEVEFELGYGEKEKAAQKWQQIDQYLAGQPGLAPFYPAPKRFNVIVKALTNLGVKDIQSYLLTPAQVQPPQPSPMEQAQLATLQADAAVKQAQAQAAIAKIHLETQQAQLTAQIEMAKLQLAQQKLQAEIAHQTDTLAHQVAVDGTEMALQAQAAAQGKVTAVAEPK